MTPTLSSAIRNKPHALLLLLAMLCILLGACLAQKPSIREAPQTTDMPNPMSSGDSLPLQTPTIRLPAQGLFITSDKLQQCYLLSSNNEIIKYNKNGKALFRYTNNQMGRPTWIDATDPFHILVFYPQYLSLVVLDRTLNETVRYSLYDFAASDVSAIAMANDNKIWIYDESAAKLKKIDSSGKSITESTNIQLLLGKDVHIFNMIEANNKVYLNAPEIGILVFDRFGTYLRKLPILRLNHFQILDQQLIYQQEGKLWAYHLPSNTTSQIELPFLLEKDDLVQVQKGVTYVLKINELWIY